ncbi:hypothetical protein COV05_00960 [Candidatus Uhrbacteria bacterium CG10_big_fil_rev_8_21_14_0_10_48_16]|uniref:Uncharacterized protein n=1 Tax=Candidatus Uhrbacteria bacterium CG10_big_fil_rev_8_21_14_0_10_48_16 TaxID=1975038 RepID=A0A2M8LIA0_9BACT|nr:MAG: hypothetical protein COV05_00960 [Candidatus Uhrbacteria bacterium CG10_big_fil_rev_8_21_14_0_10_48_16]
MDSAFLMGIIHPGQVLFALTVLFFGSAFTLSFLIGTKAQVVRPLIGVLFLILFLLLGTVAIEFSQAATPSYTYGTFASLSEALSTHRWLLFQLPIILTLTSLLVLFVYGEKIGHAHARLYRTTVLIAIAISFASVLAIIFESMI